MSSRTDWFIRIGAIVGVLICSLALGSVASGWLQEVSRYHPMWAYFSKPAGYYVNERIDPPSTRARHTIMIFGRATCGACQASQPAIKELAAAVKAHSETNIEFIDVSGRLDSAERQFAAEAGIRESLIRSASSEQLKNVRSVPFFMIVAADGRIEYTLTGRPTAQHVAAMIGVLTR
jgi:hypothetical protein